MRRAGPPRPGGGADAGPAVPSSGAALFEITGTAGEAEAYKSVYNHMKKALSLLRKGPWPW